MRICYTKKNLNYLIEFNQARPYAYAHYQRLTGYSATNQSLAHPLGANFREILGILNYSYCRFDFQCQSIYALYGTDGDNLNYGKNIFLNNYIHPKDYQNFIGQGVKTDFYYTELKISYLLNPAYNLRIETAGIYRKESTVKANTYIVTFGLRSTFRNLYQDF